jgi:hypothetical protein
VQSGPGLLLVVSRDAGRAGNLPVQLLIAQPPRRRIRSISAARRSVRQ